MDIRGALQSKTGRDRSRQLRLWLVKRRDRSWFWRPVLDLQRGQGIHRLTTLVSLQVVDYKANKRKKQERKKLAALEKGPTHKDDITVWNDTIHIPNIPPTGLNRCRLIDVKYELEVSNIRLTETEITIINTIITRGVYPP